MKSHPLSIGSKFHGYEILDIIGKGTSGVVYKAKKDQLVCALKLINKGSGAQSFYPERFSKESTTAARFNHPNLLKTFDFGIVDEQPYVAMEYIEGRELRELMSKGKLSSKDSAQLAIEIASALAFAHSLKLTHRDIKPENILVSSKSSVKLIDFGLAGEIDQGSAEEGAVGSGIYASPEQLGFIQAATDERSDLYSVGIVLFECLAGHPPAIGSSINEVFEYFQKPNRPSVLDSTPDCSRSLAQIIEKLISIQPSERYQTTRGLIHDLQNYESFDAQILKGEPIVLGKNDFRALNRDELAGREREQALVIKNLNLALSGNGRGFILEGEPGVGKSRLAKEVIAEAKAKSKLVLSGKCTLQEKQTTLSVFRKMFESLSTQIKLPQNIQLRETFQESAKGFEPALSRINPDLREYLSNSESAKGNEIDIDTYLNALLVFLCEFSSKTGGIVVFLDDVQWIDETSEKLLKLFMKQIDKRQILFLFTARNDKASIDYLNAFHANIDSQLLVRYPILPLGEDACYRIVKNNLGDFEIEKQLAKKLIGFANGNPFLLIENINRLSGSGLLFLDNQVWKVKEESLSNLGLSDNVFDLILKNLEKVPGPDFAILQDFALYGTASTIDSLSPLFLKNPIAIKESFDRLSRIGVVEFTENNNWQFAHDRIKEAVLTTLPTEIREEKLLGFAKVRFSQLSQSAQIAPSAYSELARFVDSIDVSTDPIFCFRASLAAGEFLNSSFSFGQASKTLSRVFSFGSLPELTREEKLKFRIEFAISLMESGQGTEKAREVLNEALELCQTLDERTAVKTQLMAAGGFEGLGVPLVELILDILSDHGIRVPKSRLVLLIKVIPKLFSALFFKIPETSTVSQNESLVAQGKKLSSALNRAVAMCLLTSTDKFRTLYLLFKYIELTEKLGPSLDAMKAQGWLTMTLAGLGRSPKEVINSRVRRIENMAFALKSKSAMGILDYFRGAIAERAGDIKSGQRVLIELLENLSSYLLSFDYMTAWVNIALLYLSKGDARSALAISDKYSPRTIAENRLSAVQTNRYIRLLAYLMLGRDQEAHELSKDVETNFPHFGEGFLHHNAHFLGTQIFKLLNSSKNFEHADELISKFLKLKYDFNGVSVYYAAIGEIRLNQIENCQTRAEQKELIKRFRSEIKLFRKLVTSAVTKSHIPIFESALFRYDGNFKKAWLKLKEAEELSSVREAAYARYCILIERARLLYSEGKKTEAVEEIKSAHELAKTMGWQVRADRLKSEFGFEDKVEESREQVFDSSLMQSLLNISRAASLELDTEKQISQSLDEIIVAMNAERAYVFLKKQEGEGLDFSGGRDYQKNSISTPVGYSSTVVNKVFQNREPVAIIGNEQMDALGSQSAIIHGLRSILAAPLVINADCKGVLYVDSSLSKCQFSSKDLEVFSAIASQIAIAFENLKLLKGELRKRELEKDFELTAKVQSFLLPRTSTLQSDFFELAGFSKPAIQCGGDWWWYKNTKEDRLLVFVGDITGHGAGPAMLTSYVSACFDFHTKSNDQFEFRGFLSDINELILQLTSGEFLMSSVGMEIDLKNRKLHVWNCGSPGVIVLQPGGETLHVGEASNLLGSQNFQTVLSSVDLEPGSKVFAVTDGLIEMSSESGVQFGARKVVRFLKQNQALQPPKFLETLQEEITRFHNQRPQDDDITAVMISIR